MNIFSLTLKRQRRYFFVSFIIIVSHIFSASFVEFPHIVQRIWRFFPSLFTIFINFWIFFKISCYDENNGVSIWQMISAVFYFQPTLYSFFNNCIKLYWYYISSSWKSKGWGGCGRGGGRVKLTLSSHAPEKKISKIPS